MRPSTAAMTASSKSAGGHPASANHAAQPWKAASAVAAASGTFPPKRCPSLCRHHMDRQQLASRKLGWYARPVARAAASLTCPPRMAA